MTADSEKEWRERAVKMNAKHFHLVLFESLKNDFPNLFLSLATHNLIFLNTQRSECQMLTATFNGFPYSFSHISSNSLQNTADHLSLKVSIWSPHSTLPRFFK